MQTGDKVKLKADVISGRKVLYGKANDEVTIISIAHAPVYLVQGKNGNKFSVLIENIKGHQ